MNVPLERESKLSRMLCGTESSGNWTLLPGMDGWRLDVVADFGGGSDSKLLELP